MGYRIYLNKYSCILSTFNQYFSRNKSNINLTIVRMIYNYIDKSAKLGEVFVMK